MRVRIVLLPLVLSGTAAWAPHSSPADASMDVTAVSDTADARRAPRPESVRTPYGLATRTAPLDSALAIWDESPTPLPPETNQAPPRNDIVLRRRTTVQRQAAAFLSSGAGVVAQTCDGACDPD